MINYVLAATFLLVLFFVMRLWTAYSFLCMKLERAGVAMTDLKIELVRETDEKMRLVKAVEERLRFDGGKYWQSRFEDLKETLTNLENEELAFYRRVVRNQTQRLLAYDEALEPFRMEGLKKLAALEEAQNRIIKEPETLENA